MRKDIVVLLAFVCILTAVPAGAQPEKGDNELQLAGSLFLGDKDAEGGIVALTWGRFYTGNQEAGLRIAAFFTGDEILGVGGPFWRYNFTSRGKAVPYLTLATTTNFGDFGSGDVIVDFELGSRWFLKRNTAFSLSGLTSYSFDQSDLSDSVQILFGFTYLWHK